MERPAEPHPVLHERRSRPGWVDAERAEDGPARPLAVEGVRAPVEDRVPRRATRALPPAWCASITSVEHPWAAAVAPAASPASPAPTTATSTI